LPFGRSVLLLVLLLLSGCGGIAGDVDRDFSFASHPDRAVVILGIATDTPCTCGAAWRTYDPATNQAYPDRFGQMAEPKSGFILSGKEGFHAIPSNVYYKVQHVRPGHYFLARFGKNIPGAAYRADVTSFSGWQDLGVGRTGWMAASNVDLNRYIVPRFEARAGTITYIGNYMFRNVASSAELSEIKFDDDAVADVMSAYPKLAGQVQRARASDDVTMPLVGEMKSLDFSQPIFVVIPAAR
jgi:hypothetical protein